MKQNLLSLIFNLFSFLAIAQTSSIDIAQIDSNGVDLIGVVLYYDDFTKLRTVAEISQLPQGFFDILPKDNKVAINDFNRWLKLELINSSDNEVEVMLIYQKAHNLFLHTENKHGWKPKDISFFSKKRNFLGDLNDFIPVKINACDSKTLFFNKSKDSHLYFHGKIYSMEVGWKKNYQDIQERFVSSLLKAGFLFVLVIFTLFTFLQYFQHKDNSYLLYGLYLLSLTFTYFWRYSRYFRTPLTQYLENGWHLLHGLTHYTIIIFYLLFFRSLLNRKRFSDEKLYKRLSYSLIIVIFFLIVDILLISNGYFQLNRYFLDIGIVGMMVGFLWLLWHIFQLPHAVTRYIGWGTLALFTMAAVDRWKFWGEYLGFNSEEIDIWVFSLEAMPFGILLEIMFFGMALGHRTKIMQQEKELEATKSQLFSHFTHDIRTPLTIIKLSINRLLEQPKLKLQGNVSIKNMQRAVQQLTIMTNDILDLKAKERQLIKHQGDLVAYLNYLTECLLPLASDNKIALSFHTSLPAWTVDFSEKAMQKIVSNLVINAIKFTPEGGKIKILLEQKTQQILLKVTDTGKGIKAANTEQIFEPYFQTGQPLENTFEGVGLGLTIVKQTVDLLAGSIQVESQVNKGTAFTILLPVTNVAVEFPDNKVWHPVVLPPKTHQKNPPKPTLGILPTILIVEDNLELQNLFTQFLQQEYTIVTANNGAEGFELAKKHQPEIIISDIMMPVKSGFGLLEDLKQHPATNQIPVVLVTAKGNKEDVLKGRSLQADEHLTKPFEEEELLLVLRNLQEKKAQLTQSENTVFWQGKIVTDAFAKATLQLLATHFPDETFYSKLLKSKLQQQGFGGERRIDQRIKQHFDTTPASLLRDYRLEKARHLLRHQLQLSIPEISEQVGLGNDPANFTKMYKKKFGYPPSDERK